MAHHYNLWLEYPSDWRTLRDFFYLACECTHFWTGPMTNAKGPPDDEKRDYYGVQNSYNLVSLLPRNFVTSQHYTHDVQVLFTLNQFDRWEQWQNEVIVASIRWLARSTGDALLDWDLLPILGRNGDGPIIVNELARVHPTQRELDAQRPEYQAFIAAALKREGLAYEVGPLAPIDPVSASEEDGQTEIDD